MCEQCDAYFAGYHRFKSDDGLLEYGNFCVWYGAAFNDNIQQEVESWWWHSGFPGCMPDSDHHGPFKTAEAAYKSAIEQDL